MNSFLCVSSRLPDGPGASAGERSGRAGLWLWVFAVLLCGSASGDVLVPARVLNPTSIEEAWNVLRLATANVERLLEEERLDEVTSQIVLCSPATRVLAQQGVGLEKQAEMDQTTADTFTRINLVARESMAGNLVGAENVYGEMKKGLQRLEGLFEESVVKGEVYACVEHPDSVTHTAGTKCDQCARLRTARRIPYSGLYVKPGQPTLKWSVSAATALEAAKPVKLRLKVSQMDGAPVSAGDLVPTHGSVVHLMLVEERGDDFQHLLPVAGVEPGEFVVDFTPRSGRGYSAWLGVVPVTTGLQEYLKAKLEGKVGTESLEKGEPVDATLAVVEGYRFQLSFPGIGKVRAGQTRMMRIQVLNPEGQPETQLEPFRMAFAHVAGFYEGGETILELHPQGGDVMRDDLRSGPSLAFKYYPPKVGRVRLFTEVKLGGRILTPSFWVTVEE